MAGPHFDRRETRASAAPSPGRGRRRFLTTLGALGGAVDTLIVAVGAVVLKFS